MLLLHMGDTQSVDSCMHGHACILRLDVTLWRLPRASGHVINNTL